MMWEGFSNKKGIAAAGSDDWSQTCCQCTQRVILGLLGDLGKPVTQRSHGIKEPRSAQMAHLIYPLVNIQKAIEHGHRNSGCFHET